MEIVGLLGDAEIGKSSIDGMFKYEDKIPEHLRDVVKELKPVTPTTSNRQSMKLFSTKIIERVGKL